MRALVMGTVGYMSPEQVRGLPVDHRSDIFSFGAILYELLSGQRAFRKQTAADTMSAILKEEPAETGSGPALDHIVRHCLEKDRDDRFQSAKDIGFALGETSSFPIPSGPRTTAPATGRKKLLVGIAALVVLATVGFLFLRRPPKTAAESGGLKRLAVLPFENLGSPGDEYFADGMTDEVRSKLTSLPGVEVVARGSSIGYKKTTKTPMQIGEELEAKYLLTATVRCEGRRNQPCARDPRARRAAGFRPSRLQVAAAFRRDPDGCLSGAVGYCLTRRRGAWGHARSRRAATAFKQADTERRCLRRISQGRGGLEQPRDWFGKRAEGAWLLRTGRGARPRLCPCVGAS